MYVTVVFLFLPYTRNICNHFRSFNFLKCYSELDATERIDLATQVRSKSIQVCGITVQLKTILGY